MSNLHKTDSFSSEHLFVVPRPFLQAVERSPIFTALRITDIGFFPRAKHHHRNRPAGCGEAILLLCAAGKGWFSLAGGAKTTLTKGQCVLLPPDTPHEYAAQENDPWSVYWLHAKGHIAVDALHYPFPCTLRGENLEGILRHFHTCFSLLKKPCEEEEYLAVCAAGAAILAAVQLAAKHSAQPLTQKGGSAIQQTAEYMKQNLHRSITLAELAAQASFSPSHLHALFKQATGHAPMSYFLQMKMQAASRELYFTDKPVKEIALGYGIEDAGYFSRLFKKTMGLSPLEYRRQLKG